MYRNSIVWMIMFGVISLMFVKLPPMVAKQDSVLNTYSTLVEVDALARQRFVESISDDSLVEGAIRGMMRQLDPYSGYISPRELPGFLRRNRGQFCGVGLEVGVRDGVLTVIAPIEGSSASRAGMLAGDQLVSIEGVSAEDLSTLEAEDLLVGEPGTALNLVYRRPGHEPQQISLVREHVSLQSVRGFRRQPDGTWDYWIDHEAGLGYIRVSNFLETTVAHFDAALATLPKAGLRGLILDLRFNPGGFMHQAVAMADRFLSGGLIISTVNRHSAVDEFLAKRDPSDMDVPLVILMNAGSASSAEIVAGALQARGRAKVVGERSFGKGSVQHLIQLIGQKGAVKLTVAHYRLPDGRIIHRTDHRPDANADWGIKPDVEVPLTSEELSAIQEARRQLDLPAQDSSAQNANSAVALEMDRQLQSAVRLARELFRHAG